LSATALDDGALVLVGTAWPLADDGAPRDDAAPDPWSGFVDLGSLADDPVAVRAASVPVRPGPGEGVRRNDRCPCGSGAKYKACCGR
jgi:hypothetical protein